MQLSTSTSNAHQAARDQYLAPFGDLALRISGGDLLPLAAYFGFTEPPPRAGVAASWGLDDWLFYGRRNGMTTIEKTKHGTSIQHPVLPIGVYPAGSPGDVRTTRNCAADFKRAYTNYLVRLHCTFLDVGKLMYEGALLVDGKVLSVPDLVRSLPELALLMDHKHTFEDLGLVLPNYDSCAVGVAETYAAMAHLARSSDPPVTFGAALHAVLNATELPTDKVNAEYFVGRLASVLADSRKQGQVELKVPAVVAQLLLATVEAARDSKERYELGRQQKREARQADKVQRQATRTQLEEAKTPAERFSEELEAVRQKFADYLGRFGHDITQLNSRYEKTTELLRDLTMPAPTGLIEALRAAQTLIAELQTETETLRAQMAAAQGPTKGDAAAEVYKRRLEVFATDVHTRLSAKDFMGLAQAIQVLLPIAEQLALTAGDEPETQGT